MWLPPDRIGQAANDPEQLFKVGLIFLFGVYIYYISQIVVNALASEGINGYEFYQHLKKDRKEVSKTRSQDKNQFRFYFFFWQFGQKWFKEQECVVHLESHTFILF